MPHTIAEALEYAMRSLAGTASARAEAEEMLGRLLDLPRAAITTLEQLDLPAAVTEVRVGNRLVRTTPVEPQRSWMLVGEQAGEDVQGARIAERLYLSTSPDLLRRLLEPSPPSYARLIVGYAGWGPGQLEAELEESAWLVSEVDRDLIFSVPAEEMWETAIRRLGADPATLQMSRGVH